MAFAFSQTLPEPQSAQTKITLGTAVGIAGQELSLPAYLSTSAQTEIGRLTTEIVFPSSQLTFLEIEPTYLSEQVEAKLSAQVIESKVRVSIVVPEKKKKALLQGPIAFLKFKVSVHAEAGTVDIFAEKVEMENLEGQPVEAVAKSETHINILSPEMIPLFSCFFYMH
ncbi:hypothetical protein MYX82_02640 [Acidobacteria bacterium AH-259-D05]|nr:hypothetical protein [Acidobacteria bacterium AH-259-D05]